MRDNILSPAPPSIVRTAPFDVKKVFRNGWSHPGRVRGWAGGSVDGEFADGVARAAWLDALRDATDNRPPGDAIDMGTGPGTVSQLWAEMGWRTTGLDFSPTMLTTCAAAARERGLTLDLHEGDVENPQAYLGTRTADAISSRLVLFTLPHPGRAIRRWVQMLRAGGKLVLIGVDHPNRGKAHDGWCKDDKAKKERPAGAWHADEEYRRALDQLDFMHHDAKTLRVVMEAAGLDEVRFVPMTDVVAARKAIKERDPEARILGGEPFMLVGSKAA